jgi:hypothetical protein
MKTSFCIEAEISPRPTICAASCRILHVASLHSITSIHRVKAIAGRRNIRNHLPHHLRQALGIHVSPSGLPLVSLCENQRSQFSIDEGGGALDPGSHPIP